MSEKETYQQLIDSLQTALKFRTQANELGKEVLSVTETVIQRQQQQIANLELINKILEKKSKKSNGTKRFLGSCLVCFYVSFDYCCAFVVSKISVRRVSNTREVK